jgi:uncharacterized protein DUF4070
LLSESNGNNTMLDLNFIPKMDPHKLVEGYKRIVTTIYESKHYYQTVLDFLSHYKPRIRQKLGLEDVVAFYNSIVKQGIRGDDRKEYWKFLYQAYRTNRQAFSEAVTLAIMGYHFQKVTEIQISQ